MAGGSSSLLRKKSRCRKREVSEIEDAEEVLYMQSQCSRHHEALLTPHDVFRGMEPWAKFVEPKNTAGLSF